jgi:hypothetical protein
VPLLTLSPLYLPDVLYVLNLSIFSLAAERIRYMSCHHFPIPPIQHSLADCSKLVIIVDVNKCWLVQVT